MKRIFWWFTFAVLLVALPLSAQQATVCAPCPDGAQCFVPECPEEGEVTPEATLDPAPEAVYIRIWNMTPELLAGVNLQFMGEPVVYGDIEAYDISGYQPFETAYRFGRFEALLGAEPLLLQPRDYVGEDALAPGYYDFALLNDRRNGISLEAMRVVATVETSGGLCMAGMCGSLMTIYDNAVVSLKFGDSPRAFTTVSTALIEQLQLAMAEADFEAVRAVPFTDTCPIAYDGSKFVYTFYTETKLEVIDSCETQIDAAHPLFTVLETIYNAAYTEAEHIDVTETPEG